MFLISHDDKYRINMKHIEHPIWSNWKQIIDFIEKILQLQVITSFSNSIWKKNQFWHRTLHLSRDVIMSTNEKSNFIFTQKGKKEKIRISKNNRMNIWFFTNIMKKNRQQIQWYFDQFNILVRLMTWNLSIPTAHFRNQQDDFVKTHRTELGGFQYDMMIFRFHFGHHSLTQYHFEYELWIFTHVTSDFDRNDVCSTERPFSERYQLYQSHSNFEFFQNVQREIHGNNFHDPVVVRISKMSVSRVRYLFLQ